MLMHTSGILVMTPASAMVLTGKQSLDFSGGVSAEDNFGIGGYARVMGPNGQAQYWAPNLAAARDLLMSHYEYTHVAPGESAPRRALTADPMSRDITGYPHSHPDTDDVFIVIEGRMRIELREGHVELKAGEMFVVPRGMEHKPVAETECKLLLVEPRGTVNTGEAGGAMTAENDVWI